MRTKRGLQNAQVVGEIGYHYTLFSRDERCRSVTELNPKPPGVPSMATRTLQIA